jgi:hypothetical protein
VARLNWEARYNNIIKRTAPDAQQAAAFSAAEMVKSEAQQAADLLKAMREYYLETANQYNRAQLGEELAKMLNDWTKTNLLPAYDDARTAAAMHGNWLMNAALLNYDRRWNIDNAIALYTPFSFWRLHYGLETLRRVMDRPALLSFYLHLNQALNSTQNDPRYPKRFNGKTQIALPFLPDWMGGGLFTDPLEALTSVKSVFGVNNTQENQVQDADVATAIRALATKGEISTSEAANAIANKSGALWTAMKEQMTSASQDSGGLTDVFKPHLPFDIAYKLLTGHPQDIGVLFPVTRLIRGVTSPFVAGGVNIEEPLKQGLRNLTGNNQIPLYDAYEQYRVDRMLANMVGDGTISARDALIALIERKGPAYDQAMQRVGQEGLMSSFASLAGGGGIFPEGERNYYIAKIQRDLLWNQEVAALGQDPNHLSQDQKYQLLKDNGRFGKGTPLSKFYDQHPELGFRSEIFAEPEKRLKDFLQQELSDKYYSLGSLDRRLVSDKLGQDFQTFFRNKDTRDLSKVSLEQLATWLQALKGYVPQSPDVKLQVGDTPTIQYATPEQNARYQAFLDAKDKLFGEITPSNKDAYLNWYKSWMRANPDIAQLIKPQTQAALRNQYNVNRSYLFAMSQAASQIKKLTGKYGALGGAKQHLTPRDNNYAPRDISVLHSLPPELLTLLEKKWLYGAYLDKNTIAKLMAYWRRNPMGTKTIWQWLDLLKRLRYGTMVQ